MADEHLSIGEVLALLQDEFPDVTISKIRFLESQGLIDPERTPSGYRKFYEADIDRLRWILVQQRENFLPLKVIKDRLEDPEAVGSDATSTPNAAASPDDNGAPERTPSDPVPAGGSPATVRASMPAGEDPRRSEPIWMADVSAHRAKPAAAALEQGLGTLPPRPAMSGDAGDVSLTAAELCAAAGLSLDSLRELEQYGLIAGRAYGDDTYYDGDALLVATKSGSFLSHGIGARHLRMFKVAAEREAGFLEQVAMPLLKQRNPESRRQALELVEELAGLGHELRAALLRTNLRQHLDRA